MNDENQDIKNALDAFEAPSPTDGFFDRIDSAVADEELPQRNNVRHLSRRRLLLTAGPVGIAAALIVALLVVQPGDKSTPHVAGPTTSSSTPVTPPSTIKTLLASDVIAKSEESLANVNAISASILTTTNEKGIPDSHGRLRLKADGSYWQNDEHSTISYDATTGTLIDCSGSCQKTVGVVDTDNFAHPSTSYVALMRTLRSSQAGSLEDDTYNGRPAWKITLNTTVRNLYTAVITPDADDPVQITMFIDKETAFPVYEKIVQKSKVQEIKISDLEINPTFGPHDFDAGFGQTVQVLSKPQYTRIQLADLSKHAGYVALVPSDIPSGFKLAEVSIGSNHMYDGSNEFLQNVVVLTYRRGLQSFSVTARDAGKNLTWEDPVENGIEEATPPTTKSVPLTDGAFAGTTATLVQRPIGNHLWGKNVDLVFTVSGDLSDDDMIAAAASLAVQR